MTADRDRHVPGPAPSRRWAGRGVAAAGGGLVALAFPEPAWWWLASVALVPVVLVVRAAPAGGEAVVRAWLAGSVFALAAHHWLLSYVSVFALVLGLAFGALWVPWGWFAWRLLRGRPRPPQLALALVLVPSAWVAAEYVRSWDRLGGPFGILGSTQWNDPRVLALAALGGVWLVSWVLVAANVALAAALAPLAAARVRLGALGAVGVLLTGTLAWDSLRPEPEPRGPLRVGVVQSGLGADRDARLDAAVTATRALGAAAPDLVVWGESTVTTDPAVDPELAARLARLARRAGAPLLVNVDARGADGRIAKSAVLVTAGGVGARYVKQRLVPFGEYVPLRPLLGWIGDLTRAAGEDRRRGRGVAVLDVDRTPVGPLVSFELAFPDLGRALARAGAEVIVAQSMTSSFQDTWGPEQFASLAAVRAVETGRPVVNVAISGVSATFDADGRERAWFGTAARGSWVVEVTLTGGETPYVRFGDWVPWASFVALGGAALWCARRAWRDRLGPPARTRSEGRPTALDQTTQFSSVVLSTINA